MSEPQVLYICDREKCEDCFNSCNHTTDISHAKNFEVAEVNRFDGTSRVYVVENDMEDTICED